MILITGCVGFIGSHLTQYYLENKELVIGIDNINDYYSIDLKLKNLNLLKKYPNFTFYQEDIRDTNLIQDLKPDKVVHLAGMAGVRYSLENPDLYLDINTRGFINILEQCRKNNVIQLVYASSSSVYGLNTKVPFSEDDKIDTCNSPYACSKLSMEILAKTYYQLYKLKSIGLRFFTVYGPRGRPDMAPYKFLKAIMTDQEFLKYGNGSSRRDYTYIDDIVSGIVGAVENKKKIGYGIYNLGNSNPVTLNEFIETCELVTGKKAKFKQIENQLGDVPQTYAEISKAKRDLGYEPKTSLLDGLTKFYQSLISKLD